MTLRVRYCPKCHANWVELAPVLGDSGLRCIACNHVFTDIQVRHIGLSDDTTLPTSGSGIASEK